jgi:hypothetical protein
VLVLLQGPPVRLLLSSLWVKTLPSFLLWAGGGGVVCDMFLLGGIIEVYTRRESFGAGYRTKVLVRFFQH